MASSLQARVAPVQRPARSTAFVRRTMGDPVVFSTRRQSPAPEPFEPMFVPIISIDHLSQDFEDLPVDNILALGDQALLCKFRDFRIKQLERVHKFQMEQYQSDLISQLQALHRVQMNQRQQQLESEKMRYLNQMFRRLSVDEDQFYYVLYYRSCQLKSYQGLQMSQFMCDQSNRLLSESIDQGEVLGPLVENLYIMLDSLERRQSCELLLYLSGHGMDPGNLCLIPDTIKPHPARDDLRCKDPAQCYTDECQQDYLRTFYEAFHKLEAYKGPLGFVGGELYAHQRGYVGVLGVLGLWCYAHKCSPDGLFHHLVIVADCCFAGIWGATLERIMKSGAPYLKEYHKLLLKYPVSIQCATNEFEASHGGSFTPLWYYLQTASELQLKGYERKYKEYKHSHGEPVSHDFETQHPWFISTSAHAPSWKCFDNPEFFVYLLGEQLAELKLDLQNSVNRKALEDACTPGTAMVLADIDKRFAHFSSVVCPRVTALANAALQLQKLLKDKKGEKRDFSRPYLPPDEYQTELQRVKESIRTIKQSLAHFSTFLHEPQPRFRQGGYVLDKNKLTKATCEKLKKTLEPRDRELFIKPGVCVFQGGEGDMSLIVTPHYEQVILIDGTKTADCFKKAWESALRYLPRITHIFVTHHDLDHTFGIQLLLARYCVEPTDIPDISHATIYMNTRAGFRPRNVCHEREIETLAKMLKARKLIRGIKPIIIEGPPEKLVNEKHLFVLPLLPTRELVEEHSNKVPEKGSQKKYTGTVSSRGGTTAANVLSINVVAVWKNRDAYLFTGDAHLADVTKAARRFLDDHDGIDSFKYVDVPHHGSANSNVKDVKRKYRGLAGIPAERYLISHCGNHHNPSFQTVKDILQRRDCKYLHFLYEKRNYTPNGSPTTKLPGISCKKCRVSHRTTQDWYCKCVTKEEQGKIRYPKKHNYKFFRFC